MRKWLIALLLVVPFQAHALMITGSDLDFGNVLVGDTSTLTASFDVTCEVNDIDCYGATIALSYVIGTAFDFGTIDVPVIAGGSSGVWSIDIIFAPLSAKDFLAVLSIFGANEGGDFTRFDISLIGSGVEAQQVPEPSTLALLSAGLLGLGFMRRKRAA